MGAERDLGTKLRGLRLRLGAAWAAAWLLGVVLLTTVAIQQSGRLQWQGLDAQLRLTAAATYGLAYFDEAGQLEVELLLAEPGLTDGGLDIWVLEPGAPDVVHLAPETPLFPLEGLMELARGVVQTEQSLLQDGQAAGGASYRLHAIPTYMDSEDDVPKAAIFVLGDPSAALAAQRSFSAKLLFVSTMIGLAGLLVGLALAQWSLRPVADSLEQRERFLSAAAHELRTPIATLRAVTESALAGDEPTQDALERVGALVRRSSALLEDLLLFARLDAGAAVLERQSVRLDLLVEACLPEDVDIEFEAEECVLCLDTRLVNVAVRNLISNALGHGGSQGPLRVHVTQTQLCVEDSGQGYPAGILKLARGPFCVAPSSVGAGIGLATVQMIAGLHGGSLVLENRPEGGAKATLRLG